ncbi:hypothetical protein EVAR_21069_1 [Eumeta japonica]|uniref:Uncharacterized protein n=1 Tax=Eumeta variegata TaxID=151549 RepID=A0A4C1UZY7_EUMVA|nr:hypothetical protein EVAR_21069_1 [Eumeta japonica]
MVAYARAGAGGDRAGGVRVDSWQPTNQSVRDPRGPGAFGGDQQPAGPDRPGRAALAPAAGAPPRASRVFVTQLRDTPSAARESPVPALLPDVLSAVN